MHSAQERDTRERFAAEDDRSPARGHRRREDAVAKSTQQSRRQSLLRFVCCLYSGPGQLTELIDKQPWPLSPRISLKSPVHRTLFPGLPAPPVSRIRTRVVHHLFDASCERLIPLRDLNELPFSRPDRAPPGGCRQGSITSSKRPCTFAWIVCHRVAFPTELESQRRPALSILLASMS
jgi:hypothetical protein